MAQVLNTGRLAKCVQEHAEELEATQEADRQAQEQRLRALEATAAAAAPRREDCDAQLQALQVALEF